MAAAAALLLSIASAWLLTESKPAIPGDVDRSGRVDIVDAYLLAMALRDGDRPDHDVNRDGTVDNEDVEEIARRSVELEIYP